MVKQRKKFRFIVIAALILIVLILMFLSSKFINKSSGDYYVFNCKQYRETFTKESIKLLKEGGFNIGYLGEGRLLAESFRKKINVTVMGTDENYPYLADKSMKSGAWFNGLHVEKKCRTVVVNEAAAMEFFGATDVLENEILIDGVKYVVIGVAKEDKKEPCFYIPYENMVDYHGVENGISQVFLRLESKSEVGLIFQICGMNEEDVEVLTLRQFKAKTGYKKKLLFCKYIRQMLSFV